MLAPSLTLIALLATSAPAAPAATPRMPFCTEAQLLLPEQSDGKRKLRPPAQVPTIRYAPGTQRQWWGMWAYFRVEADGRIACIQSTDDNGEPVQFTPERIEALDRMAAMRFEPFIEGGRAIAARVGMLIPEEVMPDRHLPLPRVPLSQVRMRIEHTSCMGSCPTYTVEVTGDGRVRYEGRDNVDVLGVQEYRISKAAVRQLVRRVDELDLWSLHDDYRRLADVAGITLVLAFGDKQRKIEVDGASATGAVHAFAEAVDLATDTEKWRHLDAESLGILQAQGFDFASEAGSDLLVCVITHLDTADDGLPLRLLALGASPVRGSEACSFAADEPVTPLAAALFNGRDALVAGLLARGALGPVELLDQARLDRLMLAAVRGGRLAGVQALWNAAAPRQPSLFVLERGDKDTPDSKDSILFQLPTWDRQRSNGFERAQVARWLQSKGADLRARDSYGRTLLVLAAEAGDADLVQLLLDAGLDPADTGKFGEFAFRESTSDAAAVALLEAIPASARTADLYQQARELLRQNWWPRLGQWLAQNDHSTETTP